MSTFTGSALAYQGIVAMTEEQQAIVATAQAFADKQTATAAVVQELMAETETAAATDTTPLVGTSPKWIPDPGR